MNATVMSLIVTMKNLRLTTPHPSGGENLNRVSILPMFTRLWPVTTS